MNFFFNLFQEIKRRKMFKPLAVYASFAFIAIQVTDVVIKRLFFPDWIGTFIVVVILIGFPVTFFLSWIYDITPEGIERTARESTSDLPSSAKNTKKILLPITGILTIIGGAFWVFYSLGSLSHGADLDKKLFKSIAVLYLDNLSDNREDANISAALTMGINTAISRLGFEVKARTDVNQFKNKIYSYNDINTILGVDAYIDGSIIKSPGSNEYIADISLVDAERGNNVWAGQFKKGADEVLNIPSLVVSELAQFLGVHKANGPIITENVQPLGNKNSFSLMGEGINQLDNKKYNQAVTTFDSLIINDPDNKRAIYSRGQAYEGLENYAKAIENYNSILSDEKNIPRINDIWVHPDGENNSYNLLDDSFLISKKHNLHILIAYDEENDKTDIFALDLSSNQLVWSKTYRATMYGIIAGDNLILKNASYGDREATMYIHSLSSKGKLIFSKEFSKTYNNEKVIISIIKNGRENDTTNDHLVYLNIRRKDNYSLILFNSITASIIWEKPYVINDLSMGMPKIYSFVDDEKQYVLHQKGQYLYLYEAETGNEMWHRVLDNENMRLLFHNNKVVYYSKKNTDVTIEDPVSQKIIAGFTLDSPPTHPLIFGENIIMKSDNGLHSLKTYKPFLRSIENWSFSLDENMIFKKTFILGNNFFGLTSSGDLLCINAQNGKLVHTNHLDVYEKTRFIVDGVGQNIAVYVDGFLVGLDPHNGKTLWKIRELNIRQNDLITFTENKLFVIKKRDWRYDADWRRAAGEIIIGAYNQITGELLWRSNEMLSEMCEKCTIDIHSYYNKSIYIKTIYNKNSEKGSSDFLSVVDVTWNPGKYYVPKDNLYNRLATCYTKLNQTEQAESILKNIVENIDQQNEQAYNHLSNIYLNQNDDDNYIGVLADYYDLIRHDEKKRDLIEGKFMQNGDLQWMHNLRKTHDIFIDMKSNKLMIIGQCGGEGHCSLSAYRKQSGIKLWETPLNFINHIVHGEDSDGTVLVVTQEFFDEKGNHLTSSNAFDLGSNGGLLNELYTILLIDPLTGNISNKHVLLDHDSKNLKFWGVYTFSDIYLLDTSIDKVRQLKAFDNKTGDARWTQTYAEDVFIRGNSIDIIQYNSNIIIPLGETLECINQSGGERMWSFEYTDDIDGIKYLHQDGIDNETLSFISDDDEYVVLDLIGLEVNFQEEIESDNAVRIHHVDSKYIIGYNNKGHIALYEKAEDNVEELWSKTFDSIEFLISNEEMIYIFNVDNLSLEALDYHGNSLNTYNLIWQPENIVVDKKYLGCFNDRKLYFLNL
jgi:outer membrane protein assembly factor BamB/TolB-like protein